MKKLLTLAFTLSAGYVFSQCTLSGLQSNYCTSDNGDQLTANCPGGTPFIFGPGVDANGYFDPSLSGTGSIPIIVLEGGTSYTVDQSGTYSPDQTGGATSVSLGDDQVSSQLPIGFSFRFFDDTYTTFQISSNGFITFGVNTQSGCCSGQYLPSTTQPNNVIAHVWEDLYPPGAGTIQYNTVGVAPNRKCIIDFIGIPQCCGSSYPRTSQIQLWEGCGRIEIHTASQPYPFTASTQGIENSTGTQAYTTPGRNSTAWTATNDYVAYIPNCGDTFFTTVSDGAALDVTIDSNDCFGDQNGGVSVAASGSAPFTYAWSTGGTTSSISGLFGGIYTLTISDADGCVKEETFEVFTPTDINYNAFTTAAYCETGPTGAATIAPSGGTNPYSYAWSSGASTNALTNIESGLYTVTITDANGCTKTPEITVDFENADPVVELGDPKTLCPEGIAFLVTAPGYTSYAWSNGATASSTIVNAAGTYTVTVTSDSGCVGSDDINVVSVTPVMVDLGPDISGPNQLSVDASGPGFTQYLWNTGSTNSSINVSASGNYTVTVSDTNGCSSTDQIRVDIWPSSVHEVSEGEIVVFPNPAIDVINIVTGSNYGASTIKLYDLAGKLVVNKTVNMNANSQQLLDVSSLAPGNYTLTFEADGVLEKQQVIIQ